MTIADVFRSLLLWPAVAGEDETQTTVTTDPEFLDRVSEAPDRLWVEYRVAG